MAIQAIQSHSRSCILGSVERRQKNSFGLIFEVAKDIRKPWKSTFSITQM